MNQRTAHRLSSGFRTVLVLAATLLALGLHHVALAQDSDLTIVKSHDPATVMLGDSFTWTLEIANSTTTTSTATFPADAIIIQDDLPTTALYGALSVTTAAVTDNASISCAVSGSSLSCATIGDSLVIAPGGTITVTLPVTPTAAGILTNPVTAGACAVDPGNAVPESDEENNDCSDAITVQAVDLQLTKTALSGAVAPGATLGYRLTYTNAGDLPATGVRLIEEVPNSTTFDAANSGLWSCDDGAPASTICYHDIGLLAAGAQGSVEFAVTVNDPILTFFETLSNSADIVDDGTHGRDANPADNSSTIQTALDGTVNLVATQRDSLKNDVDGDGQAEPGDKIGYTIVMNNTGNIPAASVLFSSIIPANTTLVVGSVTAGSGATIVQGNTVTDSAVVIEIVNVSPNGSVTITYDVQIDKPLPAGVTTVSGQSVISGSNFSAVNTDDPDTLAANDATVTQLTAAPQMMVQMTDALIVDADEDSKASPGDTIQYSAVIANNGNRDATEVVFSALPDANTTLIEGSVQVVGERGTVTSGNNAGETDVAVRFATVQGLGDKISLSFQVRINASVPDGVDAISLQALLTGNGFSPLPSDDSETDEADDPTRTSIIAAVNLQATKRDLLVNDGDGNGAPSPGDTLEYIVRVRNSGNATAQAVTFQDDLDPNSTMVAGTLQTSQGDIISGALGSDRRVTVDLGAVAGGQVVEISFRVAVAAQLPGNVSAVTNQGVVLNESNFVLYTDDPDTPAQGDATQTALTVTVELYSALRDYLLADADRDGRISAGDTMLYRADVINTGNSPASSVELTLPSVSRLALLTGSVTVSNGAVIMGNGTDDSSVVVNLGTIPAGGQRTVTVQLTVGDITGLATLSNQATITFTNLAGRQVLLLSDDPDTAAAGDPTISAIYGANPPNNLYLPSIFR